MASLIQVRRGLQSEWEAADPKLNMGEFGFETDTGKLKIGDGTKPWTDLDYFHRNAVDVRADIMPLVGVNNDKTIVRSDGTSILREDSGTAILENVTIGSGVIGLPSGSGGGSANTSFYRLSLESDSTELNWYTAEPADQIELSLDEQHFIGAASFSIVNNNLVMAV